MTRALCTNPLNINPFFSLISFPPSLPLSTLSLTSADALEDLNARYKLKTRVVKSLLNYTEHAHRAFASSAASEAAAEKTVVVGRYGHRDTIDAHLSFLAFFFSRGFSLETSEVNDLWNALIGQPAIARDRQVGFTWIYKVVKAEKRYMMTKETLLELFQEKMLKTDPDSLPEEGVECFLQLFLRVNSLSEPMTAPKLLLDPRSNDVESVFDFDLVGLSFLWHLATLHSDPAIANNAVRQLRDLYANPDPRMSDEDHFVQVRSILSTLDKPLKELMQPALVRGEIWGGGGGVDGGRKREKEKKRKKRGQLQEHFQRRELQLRENKAGHGALTLQEGNAVVERQMG